MADVDYTFAFASKNRYDILDTPKVARTRAVLQEVMTNEFGGLVLGTARVVDDFVQVRVRADDQHATKSIAKYLKGGLSTALGIEFADVDTTYGRRTHTFNSKVFVTTDNPNNSEIDTWIADNHRKFPNP